MKKTLWAASKFLFHLSLAAMVILGGLFLYERFWNPEPANRQPVGDGLAGLKSFGQETLPGGEREMVAALGRLEPAGKVIDVSGVIGDRIEKLLVEVGDKVKQGQTLVVLQSHDERQAEVDTIEQQLKEAAARQAAEEAYAAAAVREAELGLKQAKELGPLDLAIEKARLESEKQVKQRELEETRARLGAGGTAADRDYQQYILKRAEQDVRSAEASLKKLEVGHEFEVSKAEADLKKAQANLNLVKESSALGSLRRKLAAARVALERTELKAPREGRILDVRAREGEVVGAGPIVQLGDTDNMYAVAEVYETDIQLIRKGQRAEVTSPALGAALEGTVEQIGLVVQRNDLRHVEPAGRADARVVEVRIRIDPASLQKVEIARSLTNLQVDVRIDLRQRTIVSSRFGED